MFAAYFFLLPCFVAFRWAILMFIRNDRSERQLVLAWLMLFSGVYFLANTSRMLYMGPSSSAVLFDLFDRVAILLILPLLLAYVRTLDGNKVRAMLLLPSFLPAVIMLITVSICASLMGIDGISAVYDSVRKYGNLPEWDVDPVHQLYDFRRVFTNLLAGIEAIGVILMMSLYLHANAGFRDYVRTRSRNGANSTNLVCLLALLILILGLIEDTVASHLVQSNRLVACVWTTAYAVILEVMGYIGRYFDYTPVRWNFFRIPLIPVSGPEVEARMNQAPGSALPKPRQGEVFIEADFVRYFQIEKPYLNPDLTIEMVATALHTNRTYISIFVNQFYDLTFREYVSKLRVECAKSLLLNNPDMKLDDVARQSGFLTGSQMARKFRELEGNTPSEWRAKNS